MKKWIKVIIILGIIGIIAAGLGYRFFYNKPHKNYEKAKAEFSISGEALFNEYRSNRVEAEQKYNGKVLEISGVLNKIENPDSLTIAVFIFEEGMFGDEGIRFTILPSHVEKTKSFLDKKITLKGFCTGYNDTDIILEKCSLVKF